MAWPEAANLTAGSHVRCLLNTHQDKTLLRHWEHSSPDPHQDSVQPLPRNSVFSGCPPGSSPQAGGHLTTRDASKLGWCWCVPQGWTRA